MSSTENIALATLDKAVPDRPMHSDLETNMRLPAPSDETAALPPVDRGRDAWLFLAAATVIEILVWGLPFRFAPYPRFLPV